MTEPMEIYYFHCKELKNNGLINSELNNYANFKDLFSKYEFDMILKTKQNRKNKRYRTKQKYKELFELACFFGLDNVNIVFGTMTLSNDTLRLKEETYVKKIDKWLTSHFIYAIVNKDYGSKTEREHYHFIGLTKERIEDTGRKSRKGNELFELVKKDYNLGFEPDLCIIDLNKNDLDKTINYLLKLNNHSSKSSSKNRVRIIKGWEYKTTSFFVHFKNDKVRVRKPLISNA